MMNNSKMKFLNGLRGLFHKSTAFLNFQVTSLRYAGRRVSFSGRISLAKSSRLIPGTGQILFKGVAEIADFVVLNAYNGYIEIGNNSYVGPHSLIYGQGGVTIGNEVLIGPGVRILSSNHEIADISKPMRAQADQLKPTHLGNDVWVGANAVILGGITIGSGAVVGAGSVVTKNIPDYAIVVGNPAKIIKYRE